ncbi:MAG: hypothetical protein H0U87_06490 [Acidobacteria bacterium]|nr:hypothetical protein [Acidobacteriota bacterium]
MLRAIALSLCLMVGLGVVVPFVSQYAEAGAHTHKNKKKHRKYKKYSKKWWRLYRLRQRRLKSAAARRRAFRLRQIRRNNILNTPVAKNASALQLLPSGVAAPKGWKRGSTATSPGESQFHVNDESGSNIGSASISVVGSALGSGAENMKTVGGVQTVSLRRMVIDRMIREDGWVVNDYQKQIDGKRVFVVVAQSAGAGGAIQSRLFYFTEAGGQIYSIATSAPSGDNSKRIEAESERVITSLQRKPGAVQQAELK